MQQMLSLLEIACLAYLTCVYHETLLPLKRKHQLLLKVSNDYQASRIANWTHT
jgi:hypothetical protein